MVRKRPGLVGDNAHDLALDVLLHLLGWVPAQVMRAQCVCKRERERERESEHVMGREKKKEREKATEIDSA